jgi:5-methylcytosine-specific restriction endonuclease McrA
MAVACGAKTYFNGNTCVRGHVAPRAVSSRNCVACLYEDSVKRRTSPETAQALRDYAREYAAKRRDEDPQFRERQREAGRRHDAKPERRAKQNERRKWLVANDNDFRDRINERDAPAKRAWKKANPEAVRSHDRTRRSRLVGAEGSHTAADIEAIHARQKYKCAECGVSTKKKKHVDHVMPLALGGSNWPSNLQILCPFCNDSKGAKHPHEFAQRKGRLL